MPENVSKKFQKHLRNVDAASTVDNASSTSKKSVKRKADEDLADNDDERPKIKRTKVEQADSTFKKVKEVSLQ